ncbi:hypothetical protein AAMO2058_001434900 [Amorphochlora amoebiformis]
MVSGIASDAAKLLLILLLAICAAFQLRTRSVDAKKHLQGLVLLWCVIDFLSILGHPRGDVRFPWVLKEFSLKWGNLTCGNGGIYISYLVTSVNYAAANLSNKLPKHFKLFYLAWAVVLNLVTIVSFLAVVALNEVSPGAISSIAVAIVLVVIGGYLTYALINLVKITKRLYKISKLTTTHTEFSRSGRSMRDIPFILPASTANIVEPDPQQSPRSRDQGLGNLSPAVPKSPFVVEPSKRELSSMRADSKAPSHIRNKSSKRAVKDKRARRKAKGVIRKLQTVLIAVPIIMILAFIAALVNAAGSINSSDSYSEYYNTHYGEGENYDAGRDFADYLYILFNCFILYYSWEECKWAKNLPVVKYLLPCYYCSKD